MSLPWHKWFHSNWLASLTRLSAHLDGRGLYRDLLDVYYQEGGIPEDRDQLIQIAATTPEEFDKAWPQIQHKFEPDPARPGWLVNAKAEEVLAKSIKTSEKQSICAKRGWVKRRRRRHRSGNAMALPTPSHVAMPIEEEEEEDVDIEVDFNVAEAFEELWNAYPTKGRVRRIQSQQEFADKIRTRAAFERVMEAIRGKWSRSEKWAKGFIMALPAWLAQESWNEDPEPLEAGPALESTMDPETRRRIRGDYA
jgi:uncharacterized protein YdaU (DUF1376 family)